MNVLITGINGIVGVGIAKRAMSRAAVYGIGRKEKCGIPCKDYLQIDIGNENDFTKLEYRWGKYTFDIVVHCAAEMSNNTYKLYQTNCYGTQMIADFAKKTGCRNFIYLSSIPVIGTPKGKQITENHEIFPKTTYQITKHLGEIIIEQTMRHVCDYKILRIASPLSPRMSDKKIAGAFIKSCIEKRDIAIWGSGTRMQNYIDVRDIAYAVERACCSDSESGLYLISGHNVTDKELACLCRKVCLSDNNIQVQRIGGLEEQWNVNGKKAKTVLGYEPQYSLEETLTKIFEEWRIKA